MTRGPGNHSFCARWMTETVGGRCVQVQKRCQSATLCSLHRICGVGRWESATNMSGKIDMQLSKKAGLV